MFKICEVLYYYSNNDLLNADAPVDTLADATAHDFSAVLRLNAGLMCLPVLPAWLRYHPLIMVTCCMSLLPPGFAVKLLPFFGEMCHQFQSCLCGWFRTFSCLKQKTVNSTVRRNTF